MGKLLVVTLIGVAVALQGSAADAQVPLPLAMNLVYSHDTGIVNIRGVAAPGTVVSVRNASAVVGQSGAFTLTTTLPISIVAVRKDRIRRLRIDLPERAEDYLSKLSIYVNLTRMQAAVAAALTMTSHPPATVIVHNVEAGSTVTAPLTRGTFRMGVPLVAQTNTLECAVRVGVLQVAAPSVTLTVQ